MRILLVILCVLATPAPALACGGFFCNAVVDPVVQTAERILFRVNGDGTVTTVVEIQFEGEPVDFGWVLPVPAGTTPDAVSTVAGGLFDDLEELTAPRFVVAQAAVGMEDADSAYMGMSSGCVGPFGYGGSSGWDGWDGGGGWTGVEVVGAAVAGPYAIELITAEDSGNLIGWLQSNGYQIPSTAAQPMSRYISAGMHFLGLKLQPDVAAGPIDALEFTYPAEAPMLPLVLTSVAAVEDMDVTAYVLADERWAPTNYAEVDFDWSVVRFVDDTETDYAEILPLVTDAAGGRAFTTEYAGSTDAMTMSAEKSTAQLLRTGSYLTRFRTVISPSEMTDDPIWTAAPELGDVSNIHEIDAGGSSLASLAWLAILGLGVVRRGRRRAES